MTNFQRTAAWLAACGKEPGNQDQFSVQLGCDIEEMVEALGCIELNLPEQAIDEASASIRLLAHIADLLKKGVTKARVIDGKHAEFLDGLCDREVTGNGLAFLLGYDKDGADKAVLDSNDAKLVDGKPVFVPGTQKIAKPEGWTPPDLTQFITQGA